MYKHSLHTEIYHRDVTIFNEFESSLEDALNTHKKELKSIVPQLVEKLHKIEHPVVAENIFGMCIAYPNIFVRYSLLTFVKSWLPNEFAVEALVQLTHDPDDLVSFRAIEICGEEKIEEAFYNLPNIIGSLSDNFHTTNKPVGLGAQKVFDSMTKLLGVETEDEIRAMELYVKQNKLLPDNYSLESNIPNEILEEFYKLEEQDLVLIPGGFFTYGLDPSQIPDTRFGWKDSIPQRKVWIPPYFIDKYPVTNNEYDDFVESIDRNGHLFCHPHEPSQKDHTRNTYWDDRFKDDHPVTGIDWYDAFAFARWKGKELPTEFQWEKAARGPEGNIWPWGNEFNSDYVNFSHTWSSKVPKTLPEWREEILKFDESYPTTTTVKASQIPQNISPYGVVGMVGNQWEWTKSDYITRRNYHPMLENAAENNAHKFAVLKGGSFFSEVGLMYPSFRGKDIPFCRHNEMGIRCVVNIPIQILRKSIGSPIINKAIY